MQRGRLILVVAAFTAVAALIFPFFSAPVIGDVAGTSRIYLLPCGALVAAAVTALAGDRGERLSGLAAVAAAAAVTAALVLTGAMVIDAVIAGRDAAAFGPEGTVGSGLWLTAIAAGFGVVGVVVGMSRRLS